MTHPLGYRKVYLLRSRWLSVRLHIWLRDRQQASEAPHNHRWSFVSVPLWGRFTETRHRRGTEGHYLRQSTVPDRGAGWSYAWTGANGLAVDCTRTRWPLLPYLCRIGEIHSFAPKGPGWHVSLVLIGREQQTASDVWQEVSR
jgi:hypothetical protein